MLTELRNGRQNLVVLRTFAKMHGLAGLRLGYTFGPPQVVDYLHRVRAVFNVNTLAQVAGLAAMDDAEHLTRTLEHTARSRAYIERELQALGLAPLPSETNFFAVYVGDDIAVADALREAGFAVNALHSWGVPGCIRVSYGTDEQNAGFVAALRAVMAQVSSAPNAPAEV
jgi:histidinol-phosphate aminotransferase